MIREVSTDEPCGLGIEEEDSRRVIWVSGWRVERERAVDTVFVSYSTNYCRSEGELTAENTASDDEDVFWEGHCRCSFFLSFFLGNWFMIIFLD